VEEKSKEGKSKFKRKKKAGFRIFCRMLKKRKLKNLKLKVKKKKR